MRQQAADEIWQVELLRLQRYDPEKTGRLVIIFALPIKLQQCVTMEANSCLQENMINDSCYIFHSYKKKLPLT